MITLDQLGESYVLNLHISYIENNAYFKFRGIGGGGGGGGGGVAPLFLNSPASTILFLVFSLSYLCVLFAFICFQFLGYFFSFLGC